MFNDPKVTVTTTVNCENKDFREQVGDNISLFVKTFFLMTRSERDSMKRNMRSWKNNLNHRFNVINMAINGIKRIH